MTAQILIILLVTILIVIFVLIIPVKLAAEALGAKRTNLGWCFMSLLGTSIMQSIGLSVPVYGSIAAFLLSSAAFAGILGTSFIRGIGIAILHAIFSTIILFVMAALFGLSLTGFLLAF